MAKRSRGGKDLGDGLDEIFSAHFDIPTRVSPYGSKLNRSEVIKNKRMLNKLRGLQENLSFVKLSMRQSLQRVADSDSKKEWRMSDADKEDFAIKQTDNIRNMCRHLGQALLKEPVPKWIAEVLDEKQALLEEPLSPNVAGITRSHRNRNSHLRGSSPSHNNNRNDDDDDDDDHDVGSR